MNYCRDSFFHTFENVCVHDNTFIDIANNEEIFWQLPMVVNVSMDWTKNQKCTKNGFMIDELVKLTTKIDSSLWQIHICHYLKMSIPILHREFF